LVTAVWALLAAVVVITPVLAFALATDDAGDATREVLFNVGHWLRWLLYLSTGVVFVFLASGPLRKARLWRLGRRDESAGIASESASRCSRSTASARDGW
jgi:hypothetical protein